MVMSELAHTVHDNMPLLERNSGNVFKENTVCAIREMYNPMMDSLASLNNKDSVKDHPTKRDVLEIMRTVLEEDEELDEIADDLFEVSAAMYLVAIQTEVVRELFRNPELFVQKCETVDGSHLSFQNVASIREMQLFVTNAIVRPGSQMPRWRARNLTNELRDLDLRLVRQHARHTPWLATQRRRIPRQTGHRHTLPTLQDDDEEDELQDLSRSPPPPQLQEAEQQEQRPLPKRRSSRTRATSSAEQPEQLQEADQQEQRTLPKRRSSRTRATSSAEQPEQLQEADQQEQQPLPKESFSRTRATSSPATRTVGAAVTNQRTSTSHKLQSVHRNTKMRFTYSSNEDSEEGPLAKKQTNKTNASAKTAKSTAARRKASRYCSTMSEMAKLLEVTD